MHLARQRLCSTLASGSPSSGSLLVSTEWLACQLKSGKPISILDGSLYMPAQQREPRREWANLRIPKAQFFDIDLVSQRNTTLPHMLPSEADFAIVASELGISHTCPVVVYDTAGLFSAARVLFTLRCFGHTQSYILDGGLPKWASEGRALATSEPDMASLPLPREEWHLNESELRTLEQVLVSSTCAPGIDTNDLLVDARSARRFSGEDSEPRPGLTSGHIPGSRSVPFDSVISTSSGFKQLLPPETLQKLFEDAGVPVNRAGPIVVSCGSGLTACILWLALRQAGRNNSVALFDGSWTEYGASPLAIVKKGAA